MKKQKTKKDFKIREALLSMYSFENVDMLYPREKINYLMSLSEKQLQKYWDENVEGTYTIIKAVYDDVINSPLNKMSFNDKLIFIKNIFKKYAESHFDNNEKKIKKSMGKLEIHRIKTFKKNVDEKSIFRTYAWRSFEGNWAISRLLLREKSSLYDELLTKVKKVMIENDMSTENVNDYYTFYGYIPSVAKVNKIINEIDEEDSESRSGYIDETKPYVYCNWTWAFEKYSNKANKKLKDHDLLKLDLKDAFTNLFLSDDINDSLPPEFAFFAFLNTLTFNDLGNADVSIDIKKMHKQGIGYGYLIESYMVANYIFIHYYNQLVKHFEKNEYINVLSVISYVDDFYIIFDRKQPMYNWTFDEIDNYLKKEMSVIDNKAFVNNTDKQVYIQKGDHEKLFSTQSISGSTNSIAGTNYDETIINHFSKGNAKIKAKYDAIKYAKEFLDKCDFTIFEKYIFQIFELKWPKIFFREIFENMSSSQIKIFLMRTAKLLHSDINAEDDNKYNVLLPNLVNVLVEVNKSEKNKDKHQVIQMWIKNFIYSSPSLTKFHKIHTLSSNIAQKNIENTFNYIPIGNGDDVGLMENKTTWECIRRLSILSNYAVKNWESKNLKHSKNINENTVDELVDEFKSNIANSKNVFTEFSYDETIVDTILGITKKVEGFEIEDDEDDTYYLKAFKDNIRLLLTTQSEDTFFDLLLVCAINKATTRTELIRMLTALYLEIWRLMINAKGRFGETTYHIELFMKCTETDRKMADLIWVLIQRRKSGSKRPKIAAYRKWIVLLKLRNYVAMSWANGSKELMHYSNHGQLHCDTLINWLSNAEQYLKMGNKKIDNFIVILSILIHDIGLLDDELFFTKSDFYKMIYPTANDDLISWYKELRTKMADNTRKGHGYVSAVIFDKLFDETNYDGRTISKNNANEAMASSFFHNPNGEVRFLMEQYKENPTVFVLSLLDLLDVGYYRIGRPYLNIGVTSANEETKMYWMKDLIVEDIKHLFKYNDQTNQIDFELCFVFNENEFKFLVEEVKIHLSKQFPKLSTLTDDQVANYVYNKFFHTELFYLTDKNRNNNNLPTWKELLGFNITLKKYELLNNPRNVSYRDLKVNGESITWTEEIVNTIAKFIDDSITKGVKHIWPI